ncbi:GNAT family N-acetyltransferase [Amphibacillus sp. MSJ-3]|uniref:GNAT family N-acetyltransferase n=1 Tax=Amphibacillus sp. MSJ-3 TaxID=2841505 RepID=UPI001C0ECF45|nr:GNAT family N-acetyltransferase [Amphibacillus sp. MSJ-3]MBU5595413.1 GNAT family N-acetyltransferase [Amphibacillus sp. MSJ-3]
MIREARRQDLNEIMIIVCAVVKKMHEQGSRQWDENYPTGADYLNDINNHELFVYEKNGEIVGVCTVSKQGHKEYHLINWSSSEPAWTIKRIAINPSYHGQGIADQFMEFAEELAKQSGIYHLTTDTFCENKHAQGLFQRHGFHYVDRRNDRRGSFEFYYYEKILARE